MITWIDWKPARWRQTYWSKQPWPALKTNLSLLNHLGFLTLYFITCLYRIYPTSAIPIAIPGCPAFASWTASTISILTLSTHLLSTSSWKETSSINSSHENISFWLWLSSLLLFFEYACLSSCCQESLWCWCWWWADRGLVVLLVFGVVGLRELWI